MGWLIALAVIAGVAALIVWMPVGVRTIYNQDGLRAWYTVFFMPVLEVDQEKEDQKISLKKVLRSIHANPQKKDAVPKVKTANHKVKEFWNDLVLLLEFYWGLLDIAVLNRMELKLTMAGDDPCDLAIHYGQAQAAMGALVAALENLLTIRKRDVQVDCDFVGSESSFYARLDFTVPLGKVIAYLFRYVINNIKK